MLLPLLCDVKEAFSADEVGDDTGDARVWRILDAEEFDEKDGGRNRGFKYSREKADHADLSKESGVLTEEPFKTSAHRRADENEGCDNSAFSSSEEGQENKRCF